MVFTFEDYRSLVRMLYEHPEWREELRPLVLSEELLRLPETQARTDATLERIARQLDNLTTRVDELDARTEQRFEAVDQRFDAVDRRFDAVDQRFDAVERRLGRVENRLSRTDGRSLEASYRENVGAIFGKWLRKPKMVSPYDLVLVEQALANGELGESEMEHLRALDLLVQGGDKSTDHGTELLMAVEISVTLDVNDVRRAAERAALLRRAGYAARALVGGESVTQGATKLAEQDGVIVDLRAVPA